MHIAHLDKAVKLAQALKSAQERLAEVHKWVFQISPIILTVDRATVLIIHKDAFEKIKDVAMALIKAEIREAQDGLTALDVDIS